MSRKIIKVLIIDDSTFIQRLYKEMLDAEPDIQVVAVASDPIEARELIKQLNPDVLTLDIEMPKMDGLTFLEKVMTLRPMPVVMSSTLTQKGADETLKALELGAVEIIGKPLTGQSSIAGLHSELVSKVRAAAAARVRPLRKYGTTQPNMVRDYNNKNMRDNRIIAIGASTGGVEALYRLLEQFPKNMPPIVITQHMPASFTASFARRLDELSCLCVKEARHGDIVEYGSAYIAPGDKHMEIISNVAGVYRIGLSDGAAVTGHKPSVDVLFSSVAKAAGNYAIGVILTGMGKDGAKGLLAMRNAGAFTIGQSEASCVVYGMPRAAKNLDAVVKELPLEKITDCIITSINRKI